MDKTRFDAIVTASMHRTRRYGHKALVYQDSGVIKLKPQMRTCKLCGQTVEDPKVIYNLMKRQKYCGTTVCMGNSAERRQNL